MNKKCLICGSVMVLVALFTHDVGHYYCHKCKETKEHHIPERQTNTSSERSPLFGINASGVSATTTTTIEPESDNNRIIWP